MGGIVWLASYPKSGNTWLRAFLHNLLLQQSEPVSINELDRIFHGDSQMNWFLPYLGARKASDLPDSEIMDLRSKIQENFAKGQQDSVFVKTHNLLGSVGGKPLIDPRWTSGAMYILRNPLDVVLSLSHHAGLSIDQTIDLMGNRYSRTETNEKNVFEVQGSWSRNVESWTHTATPGLAWFRYEDFQSSPSETFSKVTEFLGLSPDPESFRKAIDFSSFKNLSQQEETLGFREKTKAADKFFRVGTAGQWHENLSNSQIDRIVADHGTQMERFDYLP